MTWIFVAYGALLFGLAFDRKRIVQESLFRAAWILYSCIPFTHAFFTLFRAGGSPRKLVLVEIWANGFAWLFLGISLLVLLNALIPGAPAPNREGGLLSAQYWLDKPNDKQQ
jgi:hypothetical protein